MKKVRHKKILEIIAKHDVETQEELAVYLREAGFAVTQATVSRDIRELRLSKVSAGNGGQKYASLKQAEQKSDDKYARVLRDGYHSIEKAQNLLVMKTSAGMAMAVAVAIDAMQLPEVVGCIAGDDTIMIAVRTTEDTDKLMERIRKLNP